LYPVLCYLSAWRDRSGHRHRHGRFTRPGAVAGDDHWIHDHWIDGGHRMNAGFVSSVALARVALIAALATAVACGGNDGSTDPSTPRAISRVSPDSQSTPAGVKMAQPLVVLVTGGGGAPLANTPVAWTIGTGGGSLTETVTQTDAAGHAQTTYTPGTALTVAHVTAQAGSLSGLTFTITLAAGPAKTVQKFGFGSDNPAAVAGSKLTLSVKVADEFGNAIAGSVVNWSAGSGTVSAATSTTDAGGVATVQYTLGANKGTYSLTASVASLAPVTFTVTAI
jgi:adhesin/invasin